MGKTMMGSVQNKGTAQLLTPQQQQFLGGMLGPQQQQMSQAALQDIMRPYTPEQYQDFFQKSFVDPAQQTLERQIVPGIKSQFLGGSEKGSSALNQALAQAATDVGTGLGSQYLNQFNQMQSNRLQGLNLLGGMAGQRTFEPIFQQRQGLLGPILGGLGSLAGGYLGRV